MDFAVLDVGMNILDRMVNRIENGGRIEVDDAVELLQWLQFGEESHEGRQLVAGVEEALRMRKGADFVRDSRRLCGLFQEHLDRHSTQRTELPPGLLRLERKYVSKVSTPTSIRGVARGAAL